MQRRTRNPSHVDRNESLRPLICPRSNRNSHLVKKTITSSTIFVLTAFLVFANAPSGFGKPETKSAGSAQENSDPLVNAAMKKMETGVWSVKGTVTAKKPIKLQGLLAGEDFDLSMEPGVNPNTPMLTVRSSRCSPNGGKRRLTIQTRGSPARIIILTNARPTSRRRNPAQATSR